MLPVNGSGAALSKGDDHGPSSSAGLPSNGRSSHVYHMPLEPPWYTVDEEVERAAPAAQQERGEGTPIIIDNGSHELRAGFASASAVAARKANPLVHYPNCVSKYRERKKNTQILLAGRDAYCETQARSAIKSPFDGDVVCNFDVVVCAQRIYLV